MDEVTFGATESACHKADAVSVAVEIEQNRVVDFQRLLRESNGGDHLFVDRPCVTIVARR